MDFLLEFFNKFINLYINKLNKCVLFWLGANASNRHYTCKFTYVLFIYNNFFLLLMNVYVATGCKM